MFIALCIESLKLTPEEVLKSDFVLLSSILREQSYIANQRNKQLEGDNETEKDVSNDYIETIDFETGKLKKVPRAKSV